MEVDILGMPPIKRVLIVAPTPFFADRGCHMHIAEQAYALKRAGLEVLIVTYHIGRDLPGLPTRRTWSLPWYRKLGPGPSWHKFYVDPLLLWTAWRASRAFRPDIIHAHLHEGALLGWVLRHAVGVPMIFDMQGSLTGELIAHNFPLIKTSWLLSMWYALERWIDNLADALVVQSTEMRLELEGRFKVPPAQIFMAYDGVNTDVFRPGDPDLALTRQLGIPPGKKIVVYLGGLSPHKGVDILLDAFPKVLAAIPEAYLLLMGYPNEDRYRQRAQALGISHSVLVTGRIMYEDAPRYLTLGDVAVAPKRSQTEANGKIYNYMAAGLPTVAFDTVVNRDILGNLGAYVHDLNDVAGLANAIVKLLQNDEERRALSARVRTKAVTDYSWDGVARRLQQAYHAAAKSYAAHR